VQDSNPMKDVEVEARWFTEELVVFGKRSGDKTLSTLMSNKKRQGEKVTSKRYTGIPKKPPL